MALAREYRLRVKLYPFHIKGTMTKAHDQPGRYVILGGPGGHF